MPLQTNFAFFCVWYLVIASALKLLPGLGMVERITPILLFLLHRAVLPTMHLHALARSQYARAPPSVPESVIGFPRTWSPPRHAPPAINILLHCAQVVGTKYALLTDAELDSLRYEEYDDDSLAANQLSGWLKQEPVHVFMHLK